MPTVALSVGGTDYSAAVVGTLVIEAEEDVARLADFQLLAPAGVLDLEAFLGAAVVISIDGTGVFVGSVDEAPTIDERSGVLSFAASDGFQEYWEGRTAAQILAALTGATWAEEVFGRREDGWQQFQDALSTVPYAYHIDGDGTHRYTAWAGSGADYSLDEDDLDDGSLRVWTAQKRQLHNTAALEVKVRFTRRHHREHAWTWSWGKTFCEWIGDQFTLPRREMVQQVADATGWKVQGAVNFGGWPEPGIVYSCTINGNTVDVAWAVPGSDHPFWRYSPAFPVDMIASADLDFYTNVVTSAGWTGVRRWTQTVTETYSLTVQATASVNQWGALTVEDAAGYVADYDDQAWDASAGTDTPSGGAWEVDAIGDYVSDEITRAAADNVIETLLGIAATGILRAHRQNGASFRMDLTPALDLRHRVAIDTSRSIQVDGNAATVSVQVAGKVARVRHVFDVASGDHYTEVELAVSRQGGSGGSADALTAPEPPDTGPDHTAPASSTALPTRLGSKSDVDDYVDTWVGWAGNYQTPFDGDEAKIYPNSFTASGPDIEDEARDEVTATQTATYEVDIPDDTFSIRVL